METPRVREVDFLLTRCASCDKDHSAAVGKARAAWSRGKRWSGDQVLKCRCKLHRVGGEAVGRQTRGKKQAARVHREIAMRGLSMTDAELLASAQRLLKKHQKRAGDQ